MAGQKHRGPLAPGRARTAERPRDALNLRKAGASFREIANSLGVSVARAYTYCQEEMAAITRDAAEDLRVFPQRSAEGCFSRIGKAVGAVPCWVFPPVAKTSCQAR